MNKVTATPSKYLRATKAQLAKEIERLERRLHAAESASDVHGRTKTARTQSEVHFRASFEQAAVGIALNAIDGRLEQVNNKLCVILGYSREEMLRLTFRDVIHPDDIAGMAEPLKAMCAGKLAEQTWEKRCICKNQEIVWIRFTISLIRYAAGTPINFLTVAEDITERKRTEDALQESERQIRSIVKNVPGVVYRRLMRADGSVSFPYIGPQEKSLTGVSAEAAKRDSNVIFDKFHPEDRGAWFAAWEKSAKTLERFEHEIRFEKAPGNYGWLRVRAVPRRLPNGDTMWDAIGFDVTERKAAEAEIIRQKTLFELIFESSPDAIVLTDPKGNIILANAGVTRIYGYEADEILGKNALVLYENKAEFERLGTERFGPNADRIIPPTESRLRRKSGDVFFGEVSGAKLEDAVGRHIGFIAVGRDITERKHAEAALRRSETQLRLLADSMPVLIISLDAELNFRYANRAYCEIHNIEQAAILGRNVREIVGELGYRKLSPKLDPVHKGNTLEFETTYRFADGIERDIVATYVPEIDAYGEVRGFYAMLIDITERKQAEAALRQSESQLRLLADNLPVLIMSLDTDMRFRFANRAYCNIHSIKQADIIGRKLPEMLGQVGYRKLKSKIDSVLKGNSVEFETTHKFADGIKRDIVANYVPEFDALGKVRGLYVMLTDVTERKKIEDRIRLHSQVIEQTHESVVVTDREGHVTMWNKGAELMYGYSENEALGRHISFVYPEDQQDILKNEVVAPTDKKGWHEIEVRKLRKSGKEFVTHLSLSVLRNAAGKSIGRIGLSVDITERKQADEALRAAKDEAEKANNAKSNFLAAASHDLRQPIQALSLLLAALLPRVHGEEAREIIRSMGHSIESLRALLDALLDISKLDAGVLIPDIKQFPVNETLRKIRTGFADQARDKGLDFRVVYSSAVVLSDPILLERVIQNLVGNSIRYTKSGRVLLGCRRRGANLRIEVWDTGPGIPADQIETIFVEFYQLDNPSRDRSEGLGLGLAIVDRIMHLLNHRIEVTSTLDSGSVFAVELPLLMGDAIRLPSQNDKIAMGGVGEAFIIVVEDEVRVREAIHWLLRDWGCRALTAESVDSALAQLAEIDAAPDVIIADYRLRDGMTGEHAIQRIEHRYQRKISALILTGDTATERLRKAKNAGYRLLHKPVRAAELHEALKAALHNPM